MLEFYQNLPQMIDPVAFSVGFFSVRWYAIMYIIAFLVIYWFLETRNSPVRPNGGKLETRNVKHVLKTKQDVIYNKIDKNLIINLLIYSGIGMLIGARLGYVLVYNFSYYKNNILETILPFSYIDNSLVWHGISGMSYHGGLIGITIASYIFLKKHKLDFWKMADFVVPAIPAGFFFGRIGNFLNGELYGRVTESKIGMNFENNINNIAGEVILRHPSQFYEALGEGIILFIILWALKRYKEKNKSKLFSGFILFVYLIFYATIRFIIEFFREPDPQIGLLFNLLTLGQVLCLVMFFSGWGVYWVRKNKLIL